MSARRGILVIISSPSGAGKTTLAHRLLAEFSSMEFSVSYTTRPPRVGERDGVDYRFIDTTEFEAMVERDAFAEWAEVHGNRYGTSRAVVEEALATGRDVVFDVDWQGGRKLSSQWPRDSLMVFILPPGLDALESRLRRRATDEEDVIQRRLRKAIDEMRHHHEYQYRVVNDDIEEAYSLLKSIYLVRRDGPGVAAEHRRRVEANEKGDTEEHAERLIRAGNSQPAGV